jgi:hypothetical protein
MMIFLFAVGRVAASPARTERVGQLSHGEDTLVVELLAFLVRHTAEKAEVVLFPCLFVAARLELALSAISVEHEVRRRCVGSECGATLDAGSYLND